MTKIIMNRLRESVYIMANMLNKLIPNLNSVGIILCYHNISDDKWDFSISKDTFKKQLEFLLKNFVYCTPQELELFLSNKKTFNKTFFMITFDDGYKSLMEIREIVKNTNIKPIVFVLSQPNNADRKELENNYEFLNQDEIKLLINDGWDIGCHGATHSDFWKLPEQEMIKEIKEAKLDLEKQLGKEIKYFAYPRGRYSSKIINIVKEAGYKMAFSMDSIKISTKNDRFTLPRIGVMNNHSFLEFKSLWQPISIYIRGIYMRNGNKKYVN